MTGSVVLRPLAREEMLRLSGGTDVIQSCCPDDLLINRLFSLSAAIIHAFATAPSSNYMYGKVGYSG